MNTAIKYTNCEELPVIGIPTAFRLVSRKNITQYLYSYFKNEVLVSKIIRSASQSIVLIDNYIDETTLTHLAKKAPGVKALLLTINVSAQLVLDVQKADAQYGDFDVKHFNQSHDRFLIRVC